MSARRIAALCVLQLAVGLQSSHVLTCSSQKLQSTSHTKENKEHFEICETNFSDPAGDVSTDIEIQFNFTSVNVYTLDCGVSGVKVGIFQDENNLHRRGCNVHHEETEDGIRWIAHIQPHTACAFTCSALTGEDQGPLEVTRLKIQNTNNPLDVVRVQKRLLVTPESDEYRTFCWLSGYDMGLFLQTVRPIPQARDRPRTNYNGYCQLYMDEDWWYVAAWKGVTQNSAAGPQSDYSACNVACQYVRKDANVDVDWGEFVTHALYDDETELVSADSHHQCSLAYVNIQPTETTDFSGCRVRVNENTGMWQLDVIQNSGGPGSVECGAVCSCSGSISDTKWPCILPHPAEPVNKTRIQAETEIINQYHVYSYVYNLQTASLLAIFLVLVSIAVIFAWKYFQRRKRNEKV